MAEDDHEDVVFVEPNINEGDDQGNSEQANQADQGNQVTFALSPAQALTVLKVARCSTRWSIRWPMKNCTTANPKVWRHSIAWPRWPCTWLRMEQQHPWDHANSQKDPAHPTENCTSLLTNYVELTLDQVRKNDNKRYCLTMPPKVVKNEPVLCNARILKNEVCPTWDPLLLLILMLSFTAARRSAHFVSESLQISQNLRGISNRLTQKRHFIKGRCKHGRCLFVAVHVKHNPLRSAAVKYCGPS